MGKLLGALTVGQAPRPDIAPVLEAALGPEIACLHAGVLDGLMRDEIEIRFGRKPSSRLLTTRLLDGSSVVIDKDATEDAAVAKVAALEEQGCSAILMLCTGSFHRLKTKKAWLLEPDHLLPGAVASLIGDRQLGVLAPLPEQIESEHDKWRPLRRAPIYAASSPYTGSSEELAAAARALADRGADVLLMDCMGYAANHKSIAGGASGLPVILSNALVAKLVSEIV
ncbi:MAG: hypothetical protein BGP06_14745 [Rhizobiales bacterium 65-9]|nr:AroM family protein [Hyphomicrobiales bacterium]OJY36908.1 MAG: hypothetical protein BGP06_14745 [Rhizobiales bacterium 65-9]